MDWPHRYGPWALVTGATSGIGAEFAREIARRGVNIVVNSRNQNDVESVAQNLAEKYGVQTLGVAADLSRRSDVENLIASVVDLEIGLLVLNAGTMTLDSVCDGRIEEELELAALHVGSTLQLTMAMAPGMRGRGRGGIIIVSSTLGAFPAPYAANAAATKGWQRQFGAGLAEELRGTGVDVLVLCPALTETTAIRRLNIRALGKKPMPATVPVLLALTSLGHRTMVTPGWRNVAVLWALRLLPASWTARLIKPHLRRLATDNAPAAQADRSDG